MNKVLNTKNISISIDYDKFGCISFGCGKYCTYIEVYTQSDNAYICSITWKYKGKYLNGVEIMTPFKNILDFKECLNNEVDDDIFINHMDALKEATAVMIETLKVYK